MGAPAPFLSFSARKEVSSSEEQSTIRGGRPLKVDNTYEQDANRHPPFNEQNATVNVRNFRDESLKIGTLEPRRGSVQPAQRVRNFGCLQN